MRALLARTAAIGSAAACVAALAAPPTALVAPAHAQPAIAGGCSIRGAGPVAKGTQLFDQAAGGRSIAKFTGAVVPVTLSSFPADPAQARTRVSTGAGAGALRVDGYGSASSFLVWTTRDIPIVPGHVWISSAQKVRLVQATSASLTGELTILGSASQAARATAPCDAFTLQQGTARAMDVPGNGRLHSSKAARLELFDQPGGSAVFVLQMIEGTSQLFWSTESRGGFVHILSRADITIDAWAKASALEAMKRGEMVDHAIPPQTSVAGAQLAINGQPPQVVVAIKEIPIRARRDDKERPIGALEIGAEVYVMETIAGWANLLPKSLGYTPGDDGGFWVPANEVPRR